MQGYLIEFKSSYKCLASAAFFNRLTCIKANKNFKSVKLMANAEKFIKDNPKVDVFL